MPDLLTPASEMPADDMAIAEARTRRRDELLSELAQAINSTSTENASNTPDFILANFAAACLDAFAEASVAREAWYGKSLSIDGKTSDIAALEARTPAPTTDVDALLSEAEDYAKTSVMRGMGSASTSANWICRLATALRESRAREVAEPYRHALEQRLICSNLPLLTGDADADLMRFVFHEQEIALSPEAGVIAELKEQRDTALSWTATYTNMDVYRRCLAAAIARADKAEAEAKEANSTLDMYAKAWWRELKGPYCNKRHEIDALVLTTRKRISERDAAIARAEKAEAERKEDHDILREAFNAYAPFEAKGPTNNPIGRAIVVMKFLNDDLAAARAELGALGPVEYEIRGNEEQSWSPRTQREAEHFARRGCQVRTIRCVLPVKEAK